jgi:hypothetical protein
MNNQIQLIAKLKKQPRQGAAGQTAFDLLKKQAKDLYETFEVGGKDVVRATGFGLVAEAAVNAYEKINVLEKQNRKLSEAFGVNTLRAAQLSKSFDKLGASVGVNTDKLKTYAGELKKLFPGQATYLANAGKFGKDIAKQLDLMRNKMGLSAEVTEGYIRNQTLLSSTSANNFDNLENQIASYSKTLRGTYEGAFTDITEGIGNLDAETAAVFGRKGIGNLSQAVLGAKKLGVELSKVLATGTGFLDVEQAIGNEIELQMLGAKDLNVSAIQQARLQGDGLALTQELTKYLEANGEEMKRNPYLLQKSAEALGFSNDELLNMYAQLQLNGKLEEESKSTADDRKAEIQKIIALENQRLGIVMDTKQEEEFLANTLSESDKARDKAQQEYAKSVNETDQVDQVYKLATLMDSSMKNAMTISKDVITSLNDSTILKQLMGAGGFVSTLATFIEQIKAGPKTVGPGVTNTGTTAATTEGDIFIPGSGTGNIVRGPKGSFALDPDDDIIAMPNARQALANRGGGDTSAVIAALKGMSFHVTNVFDGDKIRSSLQIRQGQQLNNTNIV